MSSSGFASSTRKSALLPATTVPASVSFMNSAALRVAATMTWAGVMPDATMSSISRWCAQLICYAKSVLMGLVDDRAVEFRGQLLVHAVPVVHPDLHDVDLSGSKLLHILSGFRNGGHPVGSFRSAGFGHREASPRGAEPRCVWNRLCSYLKSHIARVLAQAHGGAHSVERLALQLVDEHRPVGRQVSVR